MLTANQTKKFYTLKDAYLKAIDTLSYVSDDSIKKVLKDNDWHMGRSATALMKLHDMFIKDFKRIEASKCIVRPEDVSDEMIEIWSNFYRCRTCGAMSLCESYRDKYCSNCGTKVDWSEIK